MVAPQTLAELLFPARDARFGSVIRALSGPQSGPYADNLMSNEDSYPRIADELSRRVPPGGVYLGVGPDQNFTLIAHCRPRLALIVDYRRRNLLVHLVHKALFGLSDNRVAYLSRLLARHPERLSPDPKAAELVTAFQAAPFDRARLQAAIAEVAAFLRPLDVVEDNEWRELARIQSRLAGPGMNARFLALPMYPTLGRLIETTDRRQQPAHFLAQENLYQRVRDLQAGDLVIPLVGDFGKGDCLPKCGEWLRAHSLPVSLLYISDVEFFLLRVGVFNNYVANLSRLPWRDDALVVRTSTREIVHPDRVPGDSSTTIAVPVHLLLATADAARATTVDDLFRIHHPVKKGS